MKIDPLFPSENTKIFPPKFYTNFFQMNNPNPQPCGFNLCLS